MKYRGDRKYIYWGITALTVICVSLLFYYCLFHGTQISYIFDKIVQICFPFIVGFCLAYLITPIINTIEYRLLTPLTHKIKKDVDTRKYKKLFRVISIITSYVFIFFCIYGLFAMVIPEIQKSMSSIVSQFPETFNKYYDIVINYIGENKKLAMFLEKTLSFDVESIDPQQIMNLVAEHMENIGSLITTLSMTIYSAMKLTLNIAIGIIISVYLIYDKEKFAAQAKKICYSMMEKNNANRLVKDCRFIHKTFIGFISGKIFDSIIIGILCFIGTTVIQLHYPTLISVIVGVTNVIPFFGPYLGAIPCAFLLLLVEPVEAVYFLIFILILQQLDGNVIGPKILGNSTGISGFWVIFAITFFGGIYGVAGMFIGVPVFAVIYAFTRRFVNRRLKNKDLPVDTKEYAEVYEIVDQEFVTKEHLYTEIKNPKYKKNNVDFNNDGKYHLFRSLFKSEKESGDVPNEGLANHTEEKNVSELKNTNQTSSKTFVKKDTQGKNDNVDEADDVD